MSGSSSPDESADEEAVGQHGTFLRCLRHWHRGAVARSSTSRCTCTIENLVVVLAFKVAGFLCALSTEHVEEVIALPAMIKIPGQPAIVEGFVNLRGRMIAVVRTAMLFQAAPQTSWNSHVILIKTQNSTTGFLVDHVSAVISVEDAVRPLAPGHTLTEYAQGELTAEGDSAVLLDAARLLLAEERTRIQQLQSELEHRRKAVEVPVE